MVPSGDGGHGSPHLARLVSRTRHTEARISSSVVLLPDFCRRSGLEDGGGMGLEPRGLAGSFVRLGRAPGGAEARLHLGLRADCDHQFP